MREDPKGLYYVQDLTRNVVGNCLVFWKRGGCGYTCNLEDARVFKEADAKAVCDNADDLRMWSRYYMKSVFVQHACNIDPTESFYTSDRAKYKKKGGD